MAKKVKPAAGRSAPKKKTPVLSETDRFKRDVSTLIDSFAQASRDRMEWRKEIDALQAAGLAEGTISYRDGKYAVLVGPQRGGTRERLYLGVDVEQIRATEASLKRKRLHGMMSGTLAQLEHGCFRVEQLLSELEEAIADTRPPGLPSDAYDILR